MKEYICKEVQTENGGHLETETELIRCKDCKYWKSEYAEVGGCDMFKSAGMRCSTISDFFCAMAKPKESENA